MLSASEIRKAFLDFFASKHHQIVPSAPIVVKNDPTLLFTNAGMNQFKDYFLGNKVPPSPRVADTQKCLRVSGKHNDLEEVGVDTYHHTMFEMLGNWSFGNYFKAEAIAWSWELLTGIFEIPKDRIYVTVFEGDVKEGLPVDEEAATEWKKYIAADRILLGNKKDNFWEMGDTGPCGPCTEIHVDCRPDAERNEVDGKTLVNADHPQVIEIWNNVFIQFNRKKDGSLEPLPAKHVDTGMGFERLVRVLQNKTSNYDTDVFTPTIRATEAIVHINYDDVTSLSTGEGSGVRSAIAFRVIADHIRAIAFTIADGQLPSNTGAGYVIRRILRRAVRYYFSYLNYKQPLLYQLIPLVADQFADVFPELKKQQEFVAKVIKEEEEAFLRTLDKGLKKIDELVIASASSKVINGAAAFELLDTFGFPIDLTTLIASENGLTVDQAGFEAEMKKQKDRSRAATAIDTEDWMVINESDQPIQFVGYEHLHVETEVLRYRKIKSKGKEQYQVVIATSPFYAESGGQVGDTGWLIWDEEKHKVTDTKKENDLTVLFLDSIPQNLKGNLTAIVDATRRTLITYNHTATHLLHAALHKILGNHVNQKGSLVAPDVLRFDVSHFAKISDEELREVELMVNQKIRENIPVQTSLMDKEAATKTGAMALFGEKYGDIVRVVTIDPQFSVELCGGTHVSQTGMIGLFKITSEAAVAAGVRRIEALTGPAAMNYMVEKVEQNKKLSELLKTREPIKAIEKLIAEKATLEKRVEALEARQLVAVRNELLHKDEIINGVTFIGDVVEVSNAEALKKLCYDLNNHLNDYLAVLCANIGGKAHVAVGMSEKVAVAKSLDAGKLIKEKISPLIKGGGGGQKTLATAGGQDVSRFSEIFHAVKNAIT